MALFIDTEFSGPRLLSVAVVGQDGTVLYDSLVRPEDMKFDVTWAISAKVHGIYPRNVYHAPPAKQVREEILRLCAGQMVVAYASGAEKSKLPGLVDVAQVVCAAQAYKAFKGYTRIVKLGVAIEECGIAWDFGQAHGALADAKACRALWDHMAECKLEQAVQNLGAPTPAAASKPRGVASSRVDRTELAEREGASSQEGPRDRAPLQFSTPQTGRASGRFPAASNRPATV